MRSLSIDQKKRFYVLVDSFEKLEPHQQRIALERMRNDKDDPQKDILTLIELHFSFPPEPNRCYTGDCIRNFILKESIGSGGMGLYIRLSKPSREAQTLSAQWQLNSFTQHSS